MTVGDRIKYAREQKNISQVDLAKAIKVTKQNLYKYENNIITNIPSDKIEAISHHLDISPAYLMGWEEFPEEDDDTYLVVGFGQTGGPKKVRSPKETAIAALNEVAKELSVEEIEEVTRFARYTKDNKRKE